jgi:two-component system nitrogen regulation sensor histidine kinase NtrY
MVFKSYQLQIILRLAVMAITCYGIAFVYQTGSYWVTFGNLVLFVLLQIYLLFRYLTRWQQNVSVFADSVRHGDYSITYNLLEKRDAYHELYEMLNNVSRYVREVKSEYVQQNHYFEYVVENAQVGLMAYDAVGDIVLINREALKLTGQLTLKNLHHLRHRDPDLYNHLITLGLNQSRLILSKKETHLKLSARLSQFVIDGKQMFLISLLNIRPELEENELLSWQQLISVLTHEIMNSVTPIHSLNGSMSKYLDRIQGNEETVIKARNNLEVINRRSQSLMTFVDRYRKISTVPLPNLQTLDVGELLHSVVNLLQENLKNIRITVNHQHEKLQADYSQLEQVLINLILNAVYAMETSAHKELTLGVLKNDQNLMILVEDTGKGISADMINRIFIPFFTTREGGSGIGLTLSRQIMQRHGGSIEVKSQEGKGATFLLVFSNPGSGA